MRKAYRLTGFAWCFMALLSCAGQDTEPMPAPAQNPVAVKDKEAMPPTEEDSLTSYLALGDSYTIGQSVEERERWPVQLQQRLSEYNIKVDELEIIAQTGWTTSNLMDAIDRRDFNQTFDIVSLLIGVNNQYQGRSIDEFATEFKVLLNTAIALAGGRKDKVFVLSIPDYSVTPFARYGDTDKIAEEIAAFNRVSKEIALEKDIKYFDITPISLKAKGDPEAYLAFDGLHPSGKMYGEWVDLIAPEVSDLIKQE